MPKARNDMMASRYAAPAPAEAAHGWRIGRLTPPSRLFGANGIRFAPDGRLWIAQVGGSQISALDVDDGAISVISPKGGAIVAPDDLAFDDAGSLYVTEITEGRVCRRTRDGRVSVIRGDIPVANAITFHQGRLFVGECRMGGRILELDLDGGEPRLIAGDLPMVNAFEAGPDGLLYFPVMGANQIWRVPLAGGSPEVVAGDLGVPDAVKFDARGRMLSTQVASGQLLRIDPQTGAREMLADLGPGLDNVAIRDGRIFVSSIPGEITEILSSGGTRPVVSRGLQWPLGLALGADGALFVADGAFGYRLFPGGGLELAGMIFAPGCPGYLRGVAAGAQPGEWLVTTGLGAVARYHPAEGRSTLLASGLDRLMGVAERADGSLAVVEHGSGRLLAIDDGSVTVLATGLDQPMGVAVAPDGRTYVAEAGAGRIVEVAGGRIRPVVAGLSRPEGLAFADDRLLIVDVGAKALLRAEPGGRLETLATHLPVGAPAGVAPKFLGPIGDLAGPMIPFAGIAVAPDGHIFLSGDAEGSVLALAPPRAMNP